MSGNRIEWVRFQTFYPFGLHRNIVTEVTYLNLSAGDNQFINVIRVNKYDDNTVDTVINFKQDEAGQYIQNLLFKDLQHAYSTKNIVHISCKIPSHQQLILLNALLANLDMRLEDKNNLLIDMHLHPPLELHQTHQSIINSYLSFLIDNLQFIAKEKKYIYLLKNIIGYLNPETIRIPLNDEIDCKITGAWSYLMEIKKIIAHPCPQNHTNSYSDYQPTKEDWCAFLINKSDIEYYEKDAYLRLKNQQVILSEDILFDDYQETSGIVAQEPSGLLNLNSRENHSPALLHKESIDNYIYIALRKELSNLLSENIIFKTTLPNKNWKEIVNTDFGDCNILKNISLDDYKRYYQQHYYQLFYFKEICTWLIDNQDHYENGVAKVPLKDRPKEEVEKTSLSYSKKLRKQLDELDRLITIAVMYGYNAWLDEVAKIQSVLKGKINIRIEHITYLGNSLLTHALPFPKLVMPLLTLYADSAKSIITKRNSNGASPFILAKKYYAKESFIYQTLVNICGIDYTGLYCNVPILLSNQRASTVDWKLMVLRNYGNDIRLFSYNMQSSWQNYYYEHLKDLIAFNNALLHILACNNNPIDFDLEDNLKNSLILAAKCGYDAWFKEIYRYAPQVLINLNNKYKLITFTQGYGSRDKTRSFIEELNNPQATENAENKKLIKFE